MSDPAIIAAIVGAALTAILTPFVPWAVGNVPFLRNWFLSAGHPLRLVVGVSALTATSISIVIFLILFSVSGGGSVGKMRIAVDEKGANVVANGFITSDPIHDKLCMLTKIVKHGGTVGEGTMAGHAEIIQKEDHWEAYHSSGIDAWVTCFKLSIVR